MNRRFLNIFTLPPPPPHTHICKVKDLLFLILLLFLISCDLPTSLQIKKDIEISIHKNLKIDLLDGIFSIEEIQENIAIEGAEFLENTSTEILTFVVFMPLYEDRAGFISLLTSAFRNPDNDLKVEFELGRPIPLTQVVTDATGNPFEGNLDGFDDILEGLKFKEIKSQIYFYTHNSNLTDFLTFNFNINGKESSASKLDESIFKYINEDGTSVSLFNLPNYDPNNDLEITDVLNGDIDDVDFSIFINYEGYYSYNDLGVDDDNFFVSIEAAFWITMEFIAGEGGASQKLPDDILSLDDQADLFGRKTAKEENFILDSFNSMELRLEIENNPFSEALLLIDGGNCGNIPGRMGKDGIILSFGENTMKELRNNLFTPKIELFFEEGKGFFIPRELSIKGISFKGELDYTIYF